MDKFSFIATLALVALTSFSAPASDAISPYVDGSKPFISINDANTQARSWAMCAAIYDAMAEIMSSELPARSAQLSELANGAEVATTMSMVLDGMREDMTSDQFDALWKMSKLIGSEMPKSAMVNLLADAETHSKDSSSSFLDDLNRSLNICIKNLDGQQHLIDMWRELAKSGLLQLPDD